METGGEPDATRAAAAAPEASGLGTMAAKAPGGKSLLPFDILSEDVTVRIQDQVAFTTVEQVFRNPTKQVVEGHYKFPLPPGARLNRYAMEIGGKLQEGEIVERTKGRAIMKAVIDQYLYLMRDPALVEWESGSTFKTQIFPIKAGEKKRIVLSYVQMLPGAGGKYRYVLPVSAGGAASARIPAFRIDARVAGASGKPSVRTPLYEAEVGEEAGAARVSFESKDFLPPVDWVMDIEEPGKPEAVLATYGMGKATDYEDKGPFPVKGLVEGSGIDTSWDWFMLSVTPRLTVDPGRSLESLDWIFLVDTSQSRTIFDMEVQKRLLEAIAGSLSRGDRVKILAYDVAPRIMKPGWAVPSPELLEEADAFLASWPPAGATDLEAAIAEAAAQMEDGRRSRIVLMGDGAATLGESRASALADHAGKLFGGKDATITTIGVGSSVDSLVFEAISAETGGKYHWVSTGEDLLAAAVGIIASLRVPVIEDARIEFDGIEVRDVFPAALAAVSSGEEITVLGRYRGAGALRVKMGGRVSGEDWAKEYSFTVGEAGKSNGFVPFMWASRRIDALTLDGSEEARKEIVALSRAFSLPSRFTSFIVLENEKMYEEFGVARDEERIAWEGGEAIDYEKLEAEAGGGEADMDAVLGSEGMAVLGGAADAGAGKGGGALSGPPAAAKKAKADSVAMKEAPPLTDFDSLGSIGYYGGDYYHHPAPRPVIEVTIRKLPLDGKSDVVARKIEELRAKVEAEPLHRKHREALVKSLMKSGQYSEASAEVEKWSALDAANPTVLRLAGDLTRLGGRMDEAVRIYSGVLDLSPEDEKTMKLLAGWMESCERWDEALPFRVSLWLKKPGDSKRAAEAAVAAARAERWDDAGRMVKGLLADGAAGGVPKLAPGVKLSGDLKDAVLSIAMSGKLPLSMALPGMSGASSAKFVVTLTWEKPVDLDLWVANSKGVFMAGLGGDGTLIPGSEGSKGEVFFVPKPKNGTYRIQVSCGKAGGCGTLAGDLKVQAMGKKESIPFVIEDGQGKDVAEVSIKKTQYKYGRPMYDY